MQGIRSLTVTKKYSIYFIYVTIKIYMKMTHSKSNIVECDNSCNICPIRHTFYEINGVYL